MVNKNKLICLQSHHLTTESLYPYIAYINGVGTPEDILFTGVILDYSQTECNITRWENAIYTLFRQGENLRALDEAAGDIKKYLGLDVNFKWQVYISAPIPVKSRDYFGDINGNGIAEKLLTDIDCARAFGWFANNFTRRFKACEFANIALSGWYMSSENQQLSEIITSMGYDCIFDECFITESRDGALLSSAVAETESGRSYYNGVYAQLKGNVPQSNAPCANQTAQPSLPKESGCEKPNSDPCTAKPDPVPDCEPLEQSATPKEENNEPSSERVKIHKECITEPADNLKSIVLDIDISTGAPCPPPCRAELGAQRQEKSRINKKIALGAGVAAALLGIAYIIKKSDK